MINARNELTARIPHSAEHLEALGLVVVYWSLLESMMKIAISALSGLKAPEGLVVLHKLNTVALLTKLEALLSLHRKDALPEFLEISKAIRKINGVRNDLVHATWSKGKLPDFVKPLSLKIGKVIRRLTGEYTPEGITDIALWMQETGKMLRDFMVKHQIPTTWQQIND